MGMVKEFKEFAMRGNVVDMAVGIIIGAAFGKIVSSMVNDIIMPPIGALMGGMDFSSLALKVKDAVVDASGKVTTPAVVISYGKFINNVIDFIIVAFCIFLMIKAMNTMKRRLEHAPSAPSAPTTKECPRCFSTIPIKATRCPNCTSDVK
ncbi:MAG TPA: large-conductance mechanosensitive channel protein MscL [Verrucomicrobiae bacterium]|nr:large-conductance mechanosensitive channel protein MscL [Verrucomicrobiae bacterium]